MFVIVWEFRTQGDMVAHFEREYGPNGSWELLFRKADGFIGTELLRDADEGVRYLTIDRWASRSAYGAFRAAFEEEYASIDARNEALTVSEMKIGEFGSRAALGDATSVSG